MARQERAEDPAVNCPENPPSITPAVARALLTLLLNADVANRGGSSSTRAETRPNRLSKNRITPDDPAATNHIANEGAK